jgi:hypothetical protein
MLHKQREVHMKRSIIATSLLRWDFCSHQAACPLKKKTYTIGESSSMQWSFTPDSAESSLDGGKTAEVVLRRFDGGMNNKPVTMNNMDYFGYPRNSGFLLMPNDVEAYRVGKRPFEYRGTNGLVTTVEISSEDIRN